MFRSWSFQLLKKPFNQDYTVGYDFRILIMRFIYIYISLTATIPTSKIQPFFPFYRKRIRELTLDKRAARTHLIDLA